LRARGPWGLAELDARLAEADELGDPAERACKAVTERIRYSIARIARVHPFLADHLRASVVTGTSCAYAADEPVTWRS
jgi:hypothetical protein